MGKVLGFLLRKGAAEAEVATAPRPAPNPPPQPVPAPPPPPPPVGPAATSRGTSGENTPDPVPEFTPARRQGSQVNLNKFFASAPVGLAAVLKQPSRMDLEAARSGGSVTLQTATSLQASQQQPQQQPLGPLPQAPQPGGNDVPPPRPMRERRKSMTVSEIAASMQNIDVSQAAMIMMPARLRQELAQSQSFTTQQQQQLQLQLQALAGASGGSGQLPQLSRSNAQLVAMSSGDLGSPVPGGGGGGGGGGAARNDRLERKPSIILEAVKHQQQRQHPQQHQQQASEAHLRNHAGNFSGELQQASLAQLASALAGQGPERTPAGGAGAGGRVSGLQGERRGSVVLSPSPSQQQQQQQQLAMASSAAARAGGTNSSRSLAAVSAGNSPPGNSSMGALGSQSPAGAPPPGALRRSEPGEPFRSRGVSGMPLDGVLSSAHGMGRQLGAAAGGGGAEEGSGQGSGALLSPSGGGATGMPFGYLLSPSGKDPRRGLMGGRASEPSVQGYGQGQGHGNEDDLQRQGSSTQLPTLGSGDVRLPVIGGGPGRRGGGGGGASGDARDKDAASVGPGPRNNLSAADVAAITEAMSAYQSEATRLRAAALRKVDTRIKRAVMERHMGPEDDVKAGPGGAGGYDNGGGGGASGSKTPLLRSPVGAPSRSNLATTSSQGRSRGGLGGTLAAVSGDLMNRGRGRPAG